MGADRSALERWYAVVDGDEEGEPAELLADDLQFSLTFGGTTRTGGRAELLAYLDERVSTGRRHRIHMRSASGPVEVVAGELLDGGEPIATFVGTSERDAEGRLRRYLIAASGEMRLALPAAG